MRGSRFPVCSPFSAFCLPSSGLRPVAYRLRPPSRSGASSALKFSAEFQVFAATEGRREASHYGRMIESGSRRQANEFTVIGWQFPAKDGHGLGMQAADNRAKRTQFPAGRRTPPFQHSMIPVFQSDAYRAKQSQFHPSAREWARAAGAGRRQRAKDAKRTQFLDCGFGIEDRPTAGHPLRPACPGAEWACEGCNAQNEPNSAGRPGPGRAKCAKRTQFPAMRGGTKPGGRGMRSNCAKRTQKAVVGSE